MESSDTVLRILQSLMFVVLYVFIGFGPGFIVGVMLGNRFGGGHKQPMRMDKAKESIERAALHNRQWHPDHERWKQ